MTQSVEISLEKISDELIKIRKILEKRIEELANED